MVDLYLLGALAVHADAPVTALGDEVVERIKGATRRIAVDRITLNPDCGFSPGSGAPVDMDEVYEKLKLEVAAARILRREFA